MALLPLPNPDALQDQDKWVSTTFYRFLSSVDTEARKPDRILRFIDTVTVNTYPIELSAPFGYRITKTSTKCISGSCTLRVAINGVALGGADHNVSTTLQQITRTSSNTVKGAPTNSVGDAVTVQILTNTTCIGVVLSIEFIRT